MNANGKSQEWSAEDEARAEDEAQTRIATQIAEESREQRESDKAARDAALADKTPAERLLWELGYDGE